MRQEDLKKWQPHLRPRVEPLLVLLEDDLVRSEVLQAPPVSLSSCHLAAPDVTNWSDQVHVCFPPTNDHLVCFQPHLGSERVPISYEAVNTAGTMSSQALVLGRSRDQPPQSSEHGEKISVHLGFQSYAATLVGPVAMLGHESTYHRTGEQN